MHSFNQNANQITIVYKCSCGTINTETIDNLPMANMAADNASDSENSEEYSVVCSGCDEELTCNVYVNMYESNIELLDSNGVEMAIDDISEYCDDLED